MYKEEMENMFETLTKQWGDTDNYVNDLLSYSRNLQQENKQLKENWNNLKKEIRFARKISLPVSPYAVGQLDILIHKMNCMESE